jgi:TonB family protein
VKAWVPVVVFPILFALPHTDLAAQVRSREIAANKYGRAAVLIEAAIEYTGAVRIHATEWVDHVLVIIPPETVRAWADTADRVMNEIVKVRAGEKVKTETPYLTGLDNSIVKLIRETSPTRVAFGLFLSDSHTVNTIYQPITKRQAREFVSALRRAASVADTMTAESREISDNAVKRDVGSGVVGGTGPVTDQTYFEFQVERPAAMLDDSPKPTYPAALESSGIAGEVQAQFVVSSSGKVDLDTFKVLKSTNELFTQAVRNVLPRMHFSPAQIGGKAVNQLIQQSFQFAVPR